MNQPVNLAYVEFEREQKQKKSRIALLESFYGTLKGFSPNKEIAPISELHNKVKGQEPVLNLKEQRPGTLILMSGHHGSARYLVRVNGLSLDVWRDFDRNGYRGNLHSISSGIVNEDGDLQFEPGVMRLGSQFMMPYFSYKEDKKKNKSLYRTSSRDCWFDVYCGIYVLGLESELKKK